MLLREGHIAYACLERKGRRKRNVLQGAGRGHITLRLMDTVGDDFAGAVRNFGQAPAQRSHNPLSAPPDLARFGDDVARDPLTWTVLPWASP